MLRSLRLPDNQMVRADEDHPEGSRFICPHCKKELIPVRPVENIVDHFRHPSDSCPLRDYDNEMPKGESLHHLMGKVGIQSYFQGLFRKLNLDFEVKIEEVLPILDTGRYRVADVAIFFPELIIVIENQLAGISYQSLQARHSDYSLLGIKDYWISDNPSVKKTIEGCLKQNNLGSKELKGVPRLDEFLPPHELWVESKFPEFTVQAQIQKKITSLKDAIERLDSRLESINKARLKLKASLKEIDSKIIAEKNTCYVSPERILRALSTNDLKATFDGDTFGLLDTRTKENIAVASVQSEELRKLLTSAVPSDLLAQRKPLTLHPAIASPLLKHLDELRHFLNYDELQKFMLRTVDYTNPRLIRYVQDRDRILTELSRNEGSHKDALIHRKKANKALNSEESRKDEIEGLIAHKTSNGLTLLHWLVLSANNLRFKGITGKEELLKALRIPDNIFGTVVEAMDLAPR